MANTIYRQWHHIITPLTDIITLTLTNKSSLLTLVEEMEG
jgi:hypothetical protein